MAAFGYTTPNDETNAPILICLFGSFSLVKTGRPVELRSGGKTQSLLSCLALRAGHCAPRDTLLSALWPNSETSLAGQSLHSLIYSLHRLLGDGLDGAAPVLYADGAYRLNVEAGVHVDISAFDNLARTGQQKAASGDRPASIDYFARAIGLYRGDLCLETDVQAVMERERLRAQYLTLVSSVADYHYHIGDYAACLADAQRLLACDPCREDAHRVVMRCYVRLGQRAQALRQFRLCEEILRREFAAVPEPGTRALFDQIRLDPVGV